MRPPARLQGAPNGASDRKSAVEGVEDDAPGHQRGLGPAFHDVAQEGGVLAPALQRLGLHAPGVLRAGKIMENNLLDRLAEDGRLGIDRADLQRIFDSNSSATGMADAQVEAFRSMVKEVTDRFPDGAGYQPGDIL